MAKDKASAQRRHAKKRALQRYGIDLTEEKKRQILNLIAWSKFQAVEKQSLRISVFTLEIDGKLTRVVYDKRRKELVTFLPVEVA